MFSVEGGIDIEEVAEETPEKLIKHTRRPARRADEGAGASRSRPTAAPTRTSIEGVADALVALYEVWIEEDATLAEINPLIVTPDREVKALDAKVTLDGNAMFRHPEHAGLGDSANADPIEVKAKEQDVIYVKLDGDIGILGNGAGLVMSTLDVVAQHGGEPANFLDAGGGSDAAKVKQAVELILVQRQRQGRPVQHLRRHHPLRRGRQRPGRRVRGPASRRSRSSCASTARTTSQGRRDPRGGRAAQRARRQDDGRGGRAGRRAREGEELDVDPRRQRHEARGRRHHRP